MGIANIVVLRSADGQTDWEPILPADVPEWVKEKEVMGKLVVGSMSQGPTAVSADVERPWYRAIVVPTQH